MAKFKIVKHRLSFHVIAYEGALKPRSKATKSTYKEQCISSHYRAFGGLTRANKAMAKYKAADLKISKFAEPKTFTKFITELHYAFWLAVAAAVAIEVYIKFIIHK